MAAPTKDASFTAFAQDQLQSLGRVECRAMFGGHGLYGRGIFFGILFRGRLYFKTNAVTRSAYLAKGMQPFRPSAKQTLASYYEVPTEILEDSEQCAAWAAQAVSGASTQRP